ncbi:outer membrane protein assembly factor BamB family protein [Micromonospora sp. NBC_01796]|uniref:outer membrane protein assembly factor BamB family protein n=1 Tax=Micromonospora sp. NBC_01796 TaxID=2975987 RepID=UPI002DD938C9|nr:PQQ-binding-like beta-propeller repeat protein [Micromonospora sp. NBC_01796]WSA88905.1 PQQ-like beta-propeller repeat protein [Micromonospora sp. NBC_01796]
MRSRGRVWGRRRPAVVALVAVLVVAAAAVVTFRVLAPAEVLTPARADYPAPVRAATGVVGTLASAPLIVDGRLRVYATARQIRADEPVDARTRRTPYWSYRRWPAELIGIVASGTTVVSRWSDGDLVALDARTGRIRWRADGPPPGHGYDGRRTGASTVYTPAGLIPATGSGGRAVLVVIGGSGLRGLDLSDGHELWRIDIDGSCRAGALTTTAGQLVTVDACASPQVAEFHDVETGRMVNRWRPEDAGPELAVVPVGCGNGGSNCPALRTTSAGNSRGWLVDRGEPTPMPLLDPTEAVLEGDVALTPSGNELVARSVREGTELWRRTGPGPMRIVAVQPGLVHLLTDGHELITLNSTTGAQRSSFPLVAGDEVVPWRPGFAYAADGFVAVERLAQAAPPDAADAQFYAAPQPVILAAS